MDKNIRYTHVEEIKKTTIAIVATESNRSPAGVAVWVEALIKTKADIERKLEKYPLPWSARLSRTGKLTRLETITSEMTRRNRPKEKSRIFRLTSSLLARFVQTALAGIGRLLAGRLPLFRDFP
jgi:hypothetical protein